MTVTADYIDTGLQYCIAHHGVIDCDESVCDFCEDDDDDCVPVPLVYRAQS